MALSNKPLGPSKLGNGFGTNWNNSSWGTDGPILCEICGTNHPKRTNETYIISKFLGYQVVEECCGAIIDRVYEESGEEFAIKFLEEFGENPTSPRFHILLATLNKVCIQAQKIALETAKQMYSNQFKINSIVAITRKRA